jgi:hypothetical protein
MGITLDSNSAHQNNIYVLEGMFSCPIFSLSEPYAHEQRPRGVRNCSHFGGPLTESNGIRFRVQSCIRADLDKLKLRLDLSIAHIVGPPWAKTAKTNTTESTNECG